MIRDKIEKFLENTPEELVVFMKVWTIILICIFAAWGCYLWKNFQEKNKIKNYSNTLIQEESNLKDLIDKQPK